jgi:ferredoxin-NADP reductase
MGDDLDSETMPLRGDRRPHRKFLRFDPTVSSGTLLQLVAFAGIGIGGLMAYSADKAEQKRDITQVQVTQAADRAATKESIGELKTDVREMQRTLVDVNLSLTGLKAGLDAKKGK